MGRDTQTDERRYDAFLSYSHCDTAFARRLQRRLERYRLPHRLSRSRPGVSADARRIGPIFRDRDDLPASPDLTEAVRHALASSRWLIVVCSPDAAASSWVNSEIRLFRGLHGEGLILAALLRGEPDEAFPPAMLEPTVGAPPPAPVAADFRRGRDGDQLAFLKLAAALAGVEVDALVQRDAHRRMRQMALVSGGSLAGVAVMGALTVAAILARNAAVTERNRSVKVVDYMLGDLRSRLKGVGRLDVLQAGNEGALRYYEGQDVAHLAPPAVIEHAKLLQSMGEDDTKRGDLAAARRKLDEAERETTALIRDHPDDPKVIFAHAQSRYWSGFVRWREDDLAGAKAGFDDYAVLARRLVAVDPKNSDWRMEVGYAESNLGVYALRQTIDTQAARSQFASALSNFEAALAAKPGDRDIRDQIATAYAWSADAERLSGHYREAVAWREKQRDLLEALSREQPNDASVKSDLVSNTLGLARLALQLGHTPEALRLLEDGRRSARSLASLDPKDFDAARQARVFDLFEVAAWLSEPESERPPLSRISSTLGDCSAEGQKPRNEELAAFCERLAARLYRTTIPAASQAGPMLSEHWLLATR